MTKKRKTRSKVKEAELEVKEASWPDLQGKLLRIVIFEEEGCMFAGGVDEETGALYIFDQEEIDYGSTKH